VEAVLFIGVQGAGKSTFFVERFFHTHVRISLDLLRTRRRERLLLEVCLAAQQRFVVDNTSTRREERQRYIELAQAAGFRVIGYWFDVPLGDALARNARREGRHLVPAKGVAGTWKRLEPPSLDEGFAELWRVRVLGPGRYEVEQLSLAAAGQPERPNQQ
jgi:predicted kinase